MGVVKAPRMSREDQRCYTRVSGWLDPNTWLWCRAFTDKDKADLFRLLAILSRQAEYIDSLETA